VAIVTTGFDGDLRATASATRPQPARQIRNHRCPPHAWGCPVLTKRPELVAWTCGKCGTIAAVPYGEPGPR
jgi:hypothetical protein